MPCLSMSCCPSLLLNWCLHEWQFEVRDVNIFCLFLCLLLYICVVFVCFFFWCQRCNLCLSYNWWWIQKAPLTCLASAGWTNLLLLWTFVKETCMYALTFHNNRIKFLIYILYLTTSFPFILFFMSFGNTHVNEWENLQFGGQLTNQIRLSPERANFSFVFL